MLHSRMGTPATYVWEVSRAHADDAAEGWPPFVLDRHRIVHSSAFRRLQYKTQVFVSLEGDHFRTRLTHTLEVANIARILAVAVGMREELAECVALAHDLGHTPYGHAGERALDECLRAHGGFEHNRQSLRVVEYLEHPYPAYRGLNLTNAVRACLAKHETRYDKPASGHEPQEVLHLTSPEGAVAAWADQLAYTLHDLQDGLAADLIRPEELADQPLWSEFYECEPGLGERWRGRVRPALDRMLQDLITDLRGQYAATHVLALSGDRQRELDRLSHFLRDRVYRHPRLVRSDTKARRIIRAIFDAYVAEPRLLPERFAKRVDEQGIARVAADYIAGMTDRFCADEHARLFDSRADF